MRALVTPRGAVAEDLRQELRGPLLPVDPRALQVHLARPRAPGARTSMGLRATGKFTGPISLSVRNQIHCAVPIEETLSRYKTSNLPLRFWGGYPEMVVLVLLFLLLLLGWAIWM